MRAKTDVLASGAERIRTGLWRGDGRIAYLEPVPDSPPPSAAFVQRCLNELSTKGFSSVVTAALSPAEWQAFVALGFQQQERLCLLAHDLRNIPPAPPRGLRRGRAANRRAVLEVDHRSFPPFWRLDELGLDQSLRATTWARFRVAPDDDSRHGRAVAGYAITGRAGHTGYLQRLAVQPDCRGKGLGRALVVDGLRWLLRWHAERALVNTQQGNEVAMSFYLHLGFRPQPSDLVVFRRDLA